MTMNKLCLALLFGYAYLITYSKGINNGNQCANGLGLESGRIGDDQIEASENTTFATEGRLNHPTSAWCFHYDKFIGQKAYFSVDLASVHLISGFQSQGPPKALHPIEYLRYVGLEIEYSLDGIQWETCCKDTKQTFYADDRRDKANVITTHSFHDVIASRYIRIVASTDVRWIGEAEKCFRFEILGCDPNHVTPEVFFEATAKPAGYLEATWSQPQLVIAQNEVVTLKSRHFVVNVSHLEDNLIVQEFNVSDNQLILPKPQWDTTYTFNLVCIQHELEHDLDCGRFEVKAVLQRVSESCLMNLPTCPIEQRVQFVTPEVITAVSNENQSVLINWTDSGMGWKTSKRRIKIIDENAKVIITALSKDNQNELLVEDLQADQTYQLVFAPEGPNIPNFVQEFSTVLALLPDNDNHRSFIASVNLRTAIIYSGQIRVFWDQAKASLKTKDENLSSVQADKYIVTLKDVANSQLLQKVNLNGLNYVHDFGGLEINHEYEVSLVCIFKDKQFACGSSRIYSRQPLLVQEKDYSAKVFVQSSLPRTWHQMDYSCRSSNGHLVSLDSQELELSLAKKTDLEDYWCGGNMCKNSPAPPHSMWSDGSPQLNTNFAPDSGLDGSHCCIKVELDNQLSNDSAISSLWRGENCQTMLQGICEFDVEEYLDTPSDVYGYGITPESVNMTWSTDGIYWQPSQYKVQYCHKESLSKAALPINNEDKCGNVTANGHRGRHFVVIQGLSPFSEYDFKVIGSLEGFSKETFTTATARSLPQNDVEWIVTSSGSLKLSWLKKIAEYRENEQVKLTYKALSSNKSLSVEGTSKEVKVTNLKFGEDYKVTLEDVATGQETYTFYFTAYPNCTLGQRQNMSCNLVSPNKMNQMDSQNQCAKLGMYTSQQEIQANLIDWKNVISSEDVSILWIGQQIPTQTTATDKVYCQAWSIRRSEYQSVPCETQLNVFCQADLIVESPAPSKTTLKVIPGPTHIILDWSAPYEGWVTSYKVQVEPAKDTNRSRRDERADNLTNSILYVNQNNGSVEVETREIEFNGSKPPINITNLEPETEYNFIITTSLNSKWKTTLNLDDVATTANNSWQPEGIIGFTMTGYRYKAAELSIFSIIMALIGFSIVILVFSGTLTIYPDNAVQLCFEISLLACHIFTLLGFLDGPLAWNPANQTNCLVAMIALSYLSLCAFTFLFLESLVIATQLIEGIAFKFLNKIPVLICFGFVCPLLYLVLVIPLAYNDLIPLERKVCWLNLESPVSAAIIAPNVILIASTMIVFIVTLFGSSSNEELQSADHFTARTETLQRNRSVMLAITTLMSLGYIFGITSAHFQAPGLIITFMVVHLFLALVIFAFRCISDEQIRVNLKRMANRDKEYETTSARARSAASGIMSATSRKSTQVAPQPDEASRITPVEQSTDLNADIESPTPTAKERPRTVFKEPSATSTESGAVAAKPVAVAKGCKCSANHPCAWHHSSNALWRELENSPYNKRKNKEALRQFRRMCNEPYAPKVTSSSRSSETSAATYTSPFGDEDNEENSVIKLQTRAKARTNHQRTPFVQSAPQLPRIKRPRSRKQVQPLDDEPRSGSFQMFLSLPNTPDTEDPLKVYPQLIPGLSSESYI